MGGVQVGGLTRLDCIFGLVVPAMCAACRVPGCTGHLALYAPPTAATSPAAPPGREGALASLLLPTHLSRHPAPHPPRLLLQSQIEKVREAGEQTSRMGVPQNFIDGHAFHTYTVTSPDGSGGC